MDGAARTCDEDSGSGMGGDKDGDPTCDLGEPGPARVGLTDMEPARARGALAPAPVVTAGPGGVTRRGVVPALSEAPSVKDALRGLRGPATAVEDEAAAPSSMDNRNGPVDVARAAESSCPSSCVAESTTAERCLVCDGAKGSSPCNGAECTSAGICVCARIWARTLRRGDITPPAMAAPSAIATVPEAVPATAVMLSAVLALATAAPAAAADEVRRLGMVSVPPGDVAITGSAEAVAVGSMAE